MERIKQKEKTKKKLYIYPYLIIFATLFMGIGYASIYSITGEIKGTVIPSVQDGVFIYDVSYNSSESNNVDTGLNNYTFNSAMLNCNVVLDENDSTSQITYDISIFNNYSNTVFFRNIINEEDVPSGANNNDNIIFEITRKDENDQYVTLEKYDILPSKESMNMRITYKYNSVIDTSKTEYNELISYINFVFSSSIEETYDFKEEEQVYLAPITGFYKIELWGAQGGGGPLPANSTFQDGGKGGYVSGIIELNEDDTLYIHVGGKGEDYKSSSKRRYGGYNGGGNGYNYAYAGGGATDIRLVSGTWDDFNSLKSRIMVAGGGGGSASAHDNTGSAWSLGGHGGGLVGLNAITHRTDYIAGLGATQTSGFAFGEAFSASFSGISHAGGGSGYYGSDDADKTDNASSFNTWYQATGGGSSFISGHNGCDAIEENSTSDNIIHTGQPIHYSGLYFINTKMIDGSGYSWTTEQGDEVVGMPTYDGASTMIGNEGNGYAKITLLSVGNEGNFDSEFMDIEENSAVKDTNKETEEVTSEIEETDDVSNIEEEENQEIENVDNGDTQKYISDDITEKNNTQSNLQEKQDNVQEDSMNNDNIENDISKDNVASSDTQNNQTEESTENNDTQNDLQEEQTEIEEEQDNLEEESTDNSNSESDIPEDNADSGDTQNNPQEEVTE